MSESMITPKATLSYPHLFAPVKQDPDDPNSKAKYSCALVFAKGTDLKAFKAAVVATAKERWGPKAPAMIKAKKLRVPFRAGEEKDYPEGSVFMNVRTEKRPGVVSIFPDPNTGKPMPITDEEEVYPGCVVRASLSVYAYDVKGNKGVTFGLNNLQKVADGDRLDGRAKAEDEFDADADAVADLSDLDEETQDVAVEYEDESGDPLDDLIP